MSSIETKNDKNDKKDIDESKSFGNKIKRTLNDFFYNLKSFLKKNIPELIIVFILILIIVLTQSSNKTKLYQLGGDDPQPQQPSESSIRTKQMVNQIGQKIRSNQTFQNVLTTIYSVLNAVYIFGVLIFTLAVVPALPLFGFMFIIFVILRNRVASLKAL